MSTQISPPAALVKTWIDLIYSKERIDVREHATQQLIGAFGSLEAALQFCQTHGIQLRKDKPASSTQRSVNSRRTLSLRKSTVESC